MARKTKSSPVLPGLSRSVACTKTKSCGRLDGHRRRCRVTLTAKAPAAPKAAVKRNDFVVKGVEVPSADRYTVVEAPVATPKVKSAAKRSPKVLPACRVVKAGIRCDRLSGHKAHGLRHRFVGIVTIVATEEPKARIGVSGVVGQHRTARRPKAAPAGRRDVTIAESLA